MIVLFWQGNIPPPPPTPQTASVIHCCYIQMGHLDAECMTWSPHIQIRVSYLHFNQQLVFSSRNHCVYSSSVVIVAHWIQCRRSSTVFLSSGTTRMKYPSDLKVSQQTETSMLSVLVTVPESCFVSLQATSICCLEELLFHFMCHHDMCKLSTI